MNKEHYYTEQEVREHLEEHGQTWEDFTEFIAGQTCPMVDGEFCYYREDVGRFLRY